LNPSIYPREGSTYTRLAKSYAMINSINYMDMRSHWWTREE